MSPLATTGLAEQRARSRSHKRGRVHPDRVAAYDVAGYVSTLLADGDAQVRLRHGVDLLPALVHGCDHASITTVTDGRLEVRVATDTTGRRADELQDELDEGPALQAARTGHSVIASDLRTETRWPQWRTAAVGQLEVTGVMSVLLVSHVRPLATLNLYSDTYGGLAGLEMAVLHALADPLTDALLDEQTSAEALGPAA